MIGKQTIKKYCCEDSSLIENFDIAVNSPDKWDCHHRKEIENGRIVSVKELKEQGLYYNRPAEELIFLSKAEHRRLHNLNRSDEERKKISESCKGKVTWNKGKKMSDEFCKKISESRKGRKGKPKSEEWRRKMSESMKGKHKGKHWKLVDGKRVWY